MHRPFYTSTNKKAKASKPEEQKGNCEKKVPKVQLLDGLNNFK